MILAKHHYIPEISMQRCKLLMLQIYNGDILQNGFLP